MNSAPFRGASYGQRWTFSPATTAGNEMAKLFLNDHEPGVPERVSPNAPAQAATFLWACPKLVGQERPPHTFL